MLLRGFALALCRPVLEHPWRVIQNDLGAAGWPDASEFFRDTSEIEIHSLLPVLVNFSAPFRIAIEVSFMPSTLK